MSQIPGFLLARLSSVPFTTADFVKDTAHDSTYSDMLTVLAVSSVVQKPIQTRWPVTSEPT